MSGKNCGFVAVEENAIFEVPANSAREHNPFDVASFLYHILETIPVRNADYVLFDDWAFIEDVCDVVACGADQFHAAFVRLMVRFCPDERGKKRMVNIDDLVRRKMSEEIRGKHLHVAGEHDQVDAETLEQLELPLLGLDFVLFGHRDHFQRNMVEVGPPNGIRMIADYHRDFARELAKAVTVQQVGEAMVVARNKDRDLRATTRQLRAPVHVETLCDRFEVSREGAHVDRKAFEVPLDPEEEEVVLNIEVFVGVNDVPVRSVDEFRNRGGDALLVRATYQQNGGVLHVCAGESLCISTAPGISVFDLADRRTYTPEALPGELNFPSSHTLPARETGVVIALKPA